jgi:GR25 family glycosyltransferase involved in LPS biosynthesis
MSVAASLTNLSVHFLDGVYGASVSPKALPHGFNRKPSVVGAWRAHMNVAVKMIDENIQSALILEDDADWDVALKYQMVEFARGSRFLLNTSLKHQPQSPYGDNWDMLWIGHCGVLEQRSDSRRWIISNDATVEPSEFHLDNVDIPTLEPFGKEHTRIVFKSANGCCLAGYALSLSGARKTLNMMSLRPWDGPVDWGWNDLCKQRITNFTCIAPFPQLIGVHRPAGNQSRWSDIELIENDSVGKAHSLHLVFPTRMNIERLLTGSTKFISQHPESTGPEMEFEDIIKFKGYASTIPLELAPIPKH